MQLFRVNQNYNAHHLQSATELVQLEKSTKTQNLKFSCTGNNRKVEKNCIWQTFCLFLMFEIMWFYIFSFYLLYLHLLRIKFVIIHHWRIGGIKRMQNTLS